MPCLAARRFTSSNSYSTKSLVGMLAAPGRLGRTPTAELKVHINFGFFSMFWRPSLPSSTKTYPRQSRIRQSAPRPPLQKRPRISTNDRTHRGLQPCSYVARKIIVIGDEGRSLRPRRKGNWRVDLSGHFVMPGFNDAHVTCSAGHEMRYRGRLQRRADHRRKSKTPRRRHRANKTRRKWGTGFGLESPFWPKSVFLLARIPTPSSFSAQQARFRVQSRTRCR